MRALPKQILALAVVAVGAIAGTLAGEKTTTDLASTDRFLRRYADALTAVLDNSPRPLTAADAVYASLDGMVAMLDPHTTFFRPDAFASMRERQEGSFHGIGVVISLRGGKVTVISAIEGTPAARLGLRAGDVIEAIEGKSTDGLDLDEVAHRLRGPEGTSVRISVSRPGLAQPLELTIERAKVPTDSVRYALLLDDHTAYLRVSDFTRTTGDEFDRHLKDLLDQGATRLLLDLRDNPGGIVDAAVEVSSALLDPGQQVFSTRGRTADSFQDYHTSAAGVHFRGPLVVLVNFGSASATEIVAGAVQDHDRGLIVGERTFGKGVVQTIYPVRDAGLALTTAKYYTPSGRCIQRDFESFFSYLHPDDESTPTPAPTPTPAGPSPTAYHTDGGRTVYGGGGIVPDVFVRQGEVSERVARLLASSAFFHFAVGYLADKPDKTAAANAFTPDAATLARFRALVVEKRWLSPADIDAALADAKDRRTIGVVLRTEVLNAGVSLSEGYRASLAVDDQVQAALKLFARAAALQASVNGLHHERTAAAHP
jgi:carboxyl-terminal processing protease